MNNTNQFIKRRQNLQENQKLQKYTCSLATPSFNLPSPKKKEIKLRKCHVMQQQTQCRDTKISSKKGKMTTYIELKE